MHSPHQIMTGDKFLIFDFDGTVADTLELSLNTFNLIAHEYDCKPIIKEDWFMLRTMRYQDLTKEYGISNTKMTLILLRIRKEIKARVNELKPIENISNSLLQIRNSGLRMGILTSNSAYNVGMFLKYNHLSDFIDFIYSDKSFFGKDIVLRRLLDHENILKEDVIYVGDETRDIEASRKVGIPVIAVAWGFHNRKTLASHNPDQIADTPGDLLGCIQKILT
jgi:phosphoglycolate phosphatase-like HAD superfamily hydrolase